MGATRPIAAELFLIVVAMTSGVVRAASPQSWPWHAGVSMAGPEFGLDERDLSNASPGVYGVDYVYNSAATTRSVAEAGFTLVRLPFRWERLQPVLNGPLEAAELQRLKLAVEAAGASGLRVVLDMHNYGRYRIATLDGVVSAVIDQPIGDRPLVTTQDLADCWRRLAGEFHDHPAVLAYGLMNEPHDMGSSSWRAISQAVVTAVREADQRTWLLVAGDEWSHAHRFSGINGRRDWIRDPAAKTAYEAHCYLDRDASGRYLLSYDDELLIDPELEGRASERIGEFSRWLDRNKVSGFLGETGVPVADPRWRRLMAKLCRAAAKQGMPVVVWAAGDWWGEYPLSVQPLLSQPDLLRELGLHHPLTTVR